MKYKVLARTSLLVLLVITQSGCGGAAASPAPAATEAPATTEASAATEAPAAAEAPTEAATEAPSQAPVEEPAFPLSSVEKPSLDIIDQTIFTSQGFTPSHTIAFVFPDGLVAMKASGVQEPKSIEDDLTVVGAVEVGDGADKITPGTYLVEIDLIKTEADVTGRLLSKDGVRDLMFHRTEQVRNPAREESPSFPTISPIITSGGVCFVVGLSGAPGDVSQSSVDVESWFRYCSRESIDTNEAILSVQENFSGEYGTLVGSLEEFISRLKGQGFPGQPEVDVIPELTISEMEGHSNIDACTNDKKECAADIIGAPSTTFWTDFDQAKEKAGGDKFVVTEGFVRVERLLEIPDQEPVEPGVYWVRDWFDPEGKFIGTALLGVRDDEVPVYGLTIPATPAYFLDKDQTRPITSWISGWHCFYWCKWQPVCP